MRSFVILWLVCAVGPGLVAQPSLGKASVGPRSPVNLELALDQDRYLPRETMRLEVSVYNLSGQPITLRPEDDWLDVTVMTVVNARGEGTLVPRSKPVMITEVFTVNNTRAAKVQVDIAPCFELTQPGRFKLLATMKYPGAKTLLVSNAVVFEVVPGSKLWEQEFGWRTAEAGEPAETRKYTLQQLTSTLHRLRLYVCVTDAGENILQQISLGRASAADRPQTRLDRLNNLHVLHQTGPRLFTHTVINPNGEVRIRATYEATEPARARPGLKADEDGLVSVASAFRVPKADDLLPPKLPPPPASAERRAP